MKTRLCLALCVTSLLALSGCSDNNSHSDAPNPPSVYVEASSHEILAGEIVTLTARTRDSYGRDAKITWTSTAGSVKPEQNGRIARVKFDEPGTYTVKATLSAEGRDVQSDMVEIRVKPVK